MLLTIFVAKRRERGENRRNSRFDGKTGISTAAAKRAGSGRRARATRAGAVSARTTLDQLLPAIAGRSPRWWRQRGRPRAWSVFLGAVLGEAPMQARKSTRSISWSWLKQEKTTVSVPVSGSRCCCRHWAQISFIMHCIGELIEAIARWSGRK